MGELRRIESLALDKITPSPFNELRRARFTEESLEELAQSIREHGILQALVVRPLKKGRFEIVAGERRALAAERAGLKEVPVTVRELDDRTVIELQLVENLQREDPHPLDEVVGFQRLRDYGDTPEAIAARIGMSVSYVYGRLKLAELIPQLKEHLNLGKITASHAVLLARLSPEDQKEILDELLFVDAWEADGEAVLSVRDLEALIGREFTLTLAQAPFDLEDPQLYPEAGPCLTCPKRTGNALDLFPEIKDKDRCTDRKCFGRKRELHLERRLAALGEGAKRLSTVRDHDGALGPGQWIDARPKKAGGQGKCEHAVEGIVVHIGEWEARYAVGQELPVCLTHSCAVHRKKSDGRGDLTREDAYDKRWRAQEKRRREKEDRERQARQLIFEKLTARKIAKRDKLSVLRAVARRLYDELWAENQKRVCTSLEIEPKKRRTSYGSSEDCDDAFSAHVQSLKNEDELLALLRMMAIVPDVGAAAAHDIQRGEHTTSLLEELAKRARIDTAAIRRSVAAEAKKKRPAKKGAKPKNKRQRSQTSAKR